MIVFFILKFQAEIWKYIYCIMHCTKQNVICIYNFFGVIFLYFCFWSLAYNKGNVENLYDLSDTLKSN